MPSPKNHTTVLVSNDTLAMLARLKDEAERLAGDTADCKVQVSYDSIICKLAQDSAKYAVLLNQLGKMRSG